jgi:hypothetical protein
VRLSARTLAPGIGADAHDAMSRPLLLCLLVLGVAASGCATIVHGSTQSIAVNTDPPGARVMVNGQDHGATPTTLNLKRGRDHQIVFDLAGYQPVTINVEKNMDTMPFIVGNLFSWGIIGWVVDAANGAAYRLTPDQINANLPALQGMIDVSPDADELSVFLLTIDQAQAMGIVEE